MKKNLIIILIILLGLVGCERDFELVNPAQIGLDLFIVDAETAEKALINAYDDLQSRYVTGIERKALTGLYSDEFDHTGSFPHFTEGLVNNFLTDNAGLRSIFRFHYETITTCTEVIRLTNNLSPEAISASDKLEIVSEAHAIRAYVYYELVKVWGGVPIITQTVPLDGDTANNTPKSTEAQVYTYIMDEIALAEGNIASSNGYTRFTNDALAVLKAKVQMSQADYAGAESTLASLIGSYSLPTYFQLFINGNNGGAIFRIDALASDGNQLAFFYNPAGRREIAPSQVLLDAFETGDLRKNLIINNTTVNTAYVNKYTDVANGNDQPYVYRYADVILMYAEVLARRNAANASTYINMIRTRAGLGPIITFDSSNVVSVIAQERFVEFFGEGQRWDDIKRLGLASNVINAKTGITFDSRMLLWPIPQREIDANDSLSQSDQNPGY